MPTELQTKAFEIRAQKIAKKEPVVMREVLREAGASESTAARPKTITESEGWKELLAKYDDNKLMDRLNEIAMQKKGNRDSIAAINLIMKLKDRFPAEKHKYTQELEAMQQYNAEE